MTPRRSILCLAANFPWPADSGGCIRVDGLLRELGQVYDVRLLVAREHDPARTVEIVKSVEADLGITVEYFDQPRWTRSRPAAAALWARSFIAGIPPWIYGDLDHRLMARYRELAPQSDAVVLLQDFSGMYPLLASADGRTPIVADKHVVLARPRSDSDVTTRARLLRQLTRRYEERYLRASTEIVVTTDEDGRWLNEIYGRKPSAIIPTGVPVHPPRTSRSSPRRRVGWLSALDVVDNIQGLARFVADGWPLLEADGCELLVAGRNPVPPVFDITTRPGIRLLGHVESLDEFFDAIDVAVIPLWSGRGIKVKTLTFMAAGIPIAATPMAVEGMDVEDGRHFLLGYTPEELAGQVRRLLADRELADSIAAEGRQLTIDGFTWAALGPQFIDVVEHAIEVAA